MKNKILIALIFLLIIIGGLFFFSQNFNPQTEKFNCYIPIDYFLLNIVNYLIIYLLIINGTIIQSPYWRYVYLSLPFIILGVLFKIQHWAIANTLLTIGLIALPIIYTVRFFSKKTKVIIDWMKLLWVCSFFILKLPIINDLIEIDVTIFSTVLLFITFGIFLFLKSDKPTFQ